MIDLASCDIAITHICHYDEATYAWAKNPLINDLLCTVQKFYFESLIESESFYFITLLCEAIGHFL